MDMALLKTLLTCIIIQGAAAGVNVYVSLDDGGAEPSQEAFETLGEYMNRTQARSQLRKVEQTHIVETVSCSSTKV